MLDRAFHNPADGRWIDSHEDLQEGWCTACKKESNEAVYDDGIGGYDLGDAHYTDVQLYLGSECCEAPVTQEPPEGALDWSGMEVSK